LKVLILHVTFRRKETDVQHKGGTPRTGGAEARFITSTGFEG
jgi:hypothetical protein